MKSVVIFVFLAVAGVSALNKNAVVYEKLAAKHDPLLRNKFSLLDNAVAGKPDNKTNVKGYPLFKQCDPRWGGNQLGGCGGTTICDAGCAMSSVTMFIAGRGYNGNPGTLNSWLNSNGGYADGCDIYWADVDKLGYSTCMGAEDATYDEICSGVSAGHGVIINVRSGTHWVLVTGCAGNNVFYVNDPGFSTNTYR
eukprot:TRINITY_DN2957_c0_g1_i1.p2 TRINITY_DN2957_c0_g1~~TRINITY_DN2957_c0_g1_i1.p2  ORF type:complete len:211 (-),score=85.89 TRINITY_DN2957_c0_g1_i1:246-830(-)